MRSQRFGREFTDGAVRQIVDALLIALRRHKPQHQVLIDSEKCRRAAYINVYSK